LLLFFSCFLLQCRSNFPIFCPFNFFYITYSVCFYFLLSDLHYFRITFFRPFSVCFHTKSATYPSQIMQAQGTLSNQTFNTLSTNHRPLSREKMTLTRCTICRTGHCPIILRRTSRRLFYQPNLKDERLIFFVVAKLERRTSRLCLQGGKNQKSFVPPSFRLKLLSKIFVDYNFRRRYIVFFIK